MKGLVQFNVSEVIPQNQFLVQNVRFESRLKTLQARGFIAVFEKVAKVLPRRSGILKYCSC